MGGMRPTSIALVLLVGCRMQDPDPAQSTASAKASSPADTSSTSVPKASAWSPQTGVYYACDATDGRQTACGAKLDGTIVIERDGMYQRCDVANGKLGACHGPFTGRAPVVRNRTWQDCEIKNGVVGTCSGNVTGKVGAWRPS
jgi:hypothetical protein